jgi:CTP synthase
VLCVEWARVNRVPFLGICLGFQMAVIEYSRNVLGWKDAHSTEFDPKCGHPVISELPDQKRLEGIMGGTMRLGAQDVAVQAGSLASFLWRGATTVRERFRHRYEVDPTFIQQLESAGLVFSGRHPKHPIMQMLELPVKEHPFFIGAQFHPELTSRPLVPQPMFMGLIAAAIAQRDPTFAQSELGRRWVRSTSNAPSQPAA